MTEVELQNMFSTLTRQPVPSRYAAGSARVTSRGRRRSRRIAVAGVAAGTIAAVTVGALVLDSDGSRAQPVEPTSVVVPWKNLTPGPNDGTVKQDLTINPLSGKPVAASLILPPYQPDGSGRYSFTVRLSNRGAEPLPLEPACPFYRTAFETEVESGYLNCADAPSAIPVGGHVDFAMQVPAQARGVGPYRVTWDLGAMTHEWAGARGEVTWGEPLPDPPPRLTKDSVRAVVSQPLRPYSGPNPPPVSEAEVLAGTKTDDYVVALVDLGFEHADGSVDWRSVWILGAVTFVEDITLGYRGPAQPEPLERRPGWSRSLYVVDAVTGDGVSTTVF